MNLVVLGAAGAMGAQAAAALAGSGRFAGIIVADAELPKLERPAQACGLPPGAAVCLDAGDPAALAGLLAGRPAVVVNALPRRFALPVAEAVIEAGLAGIDLSDISPELLALHRRAQAAGAVYVAGCGSSSGLTNMLAKHGSRSMDEVDSVEISFASFRAIALSPASVDGVFWEFGPQVPRGYYADGAYRPVKLWDGAQSVAFPEPIGAQTVYIVPQSETHTLPRTLGARRVVVRGTFTPQVMRLMRSLVEYGFFAAPPVVVNGVPVPRRELIKQYLVQAPEAAEEPVWGYALHVEVTGCRGPRRLRRTLWTTHPAADQPGWAGPDAWTRCVALPLVAGALLLADGRHGQGRGVDAPEAFLPPDPFLAELAGYGLQAHETAQELS